MKCPKCGYLGFEDVDRCRNCGYDFSLTAEPALQDLPIRRGHATPHPLDDLSLIDAAAAPEPPRMTDVSADVDRVFGAPEPAEPLAASARARVPRVDLPLFRRSTADDEPLITRASPPRAPLAVRRSSPEVARVRTEPSRLTSLDLALEPETTDAARADLADRGGDAPALAGSVRDAGMAARLFAVVLDLAILGAIDVAVVYFTMQICGLTVGDLGVLPKGPLLAFLLVQNGGYLVTFTAGGQTLGKMAAGIRIVSNESAGNPELGRALLRTVMWALLAVPAGLGFVSAIVARDHRGLHDRFAGTRVIRASA
jgi:uncharacterized RDD family membrane protein YckC